MKNKAAGKILSGILASVVVLGMAACGVKDGESSQNGSTSSEGIGEGNNSSGGVNSRIRRKAGKAQMRVPRRS